jgi:Ala-tRNA(Pro) deacylase
MNQEAFEHICQLFEEKQITYMVLDHPECRTSAESAAARAEAGAPGAIGAKALLCKMEYGNGNIEFNVLVIPGTARLNSRALKTHFADLKRFRFATPEEMLQLCNVVPGCMPPFAKTIFSNTERLFVDESLLNFKLIGFNAASLERSIVIQCQDYLRAAMPSAILQFASFNT